MSNEKEIQKKDDNSLNVSGGSSPTTLKPARFMCKKCRGTWDQYVALSDYNHKCPYCGNESGYWDKSIVYDNKIDKKSFNPIQHKVDVKVPMTPRSR